MSELPQYPFYEGVDGPIAIAHRGGDLAGAEKENSIAAFESAFQRGVMFGETDVVVTDDGALMAFHGSRNSRQEHKTGLPARSKIQSMSYEEVRRDMRIGGEPLPTVVELLTTLPEMRFFIDPKTPESVRPLATVINRLKAHDRVSIGAFDYERTQGVKELLGAEVCSTIGTIGSLALIGAAARLPSSRDYIKKAGATQFAVPYQSLRIPGAVERAHELGMRMIVWTPNTEETIDWSFNQGADGVMSDKIELLQAAASGHSSAH